MEETFITLETAKLAKEKNFDLKCIWYYHDNCKEFPVERGGGKIKVLWDANSDNKKVMGVECYSAPTQSLLQKWLREVHSIHIGLPGGCFDLSEGLYWEVQVGKIGADSDNFVKEVDCSYEEALEIGLQEALKLI